MQGKKLVSAGRIRGGVMTHVVDIEEFRRRQAVQGVQEGRASSRISCPVFSAGVTDEDCRAYREAGLPECEKCFFNQGVENAQGLPH